MSTGNDQIFEKLIDNFANVEADENKNVDEQKEIAQTKDVRGQVIKKGDKVRFDDGEGPIIAIWDDGTVDIEYAAGPGGPLADTFDIKGHDVEKIDVDEEVDEKKKPPMCKKCNKKHWPFQKCSAKESAVKEDAEVVGDVWKLESPKEDVASDYLSAVSEKALEGDKESQEFLKKIFGEKWDSIKEKLETEGSVWCVWWMDGVHELMKQQKGEATEGKSPQQGDKEATQIKKLSEEDETIVDEGFKTDLKNKDKKAIQQKIEAITDKLLTGEKLTRPESDYWDAYHAEVSKITGK
jgi:hypothetical protein